MSDLFTISATAQDFAGAYNEWLRRQLGGSLHIVDGGGVGFMIWHIPAAEYCVCCKKIKYANIRFPFRELNHCRTAKHVANLYNLDVAEFKRHIREEEKRKRVRPKRGDRLPYRGYDYSAQEDWNEYDQR